VSFDESRTPLFAAGAASTGGAAAKVEGAGTGLPAIARFELVIRRRAPTLAADEVIDWSRPLREYGIDSIGKVAVLLDLEAEFQVVLPEADIVGSTFETADSLWAAFKNIISGTA
jgi:acyl carrier protein